MRLAWLFVATVLLLLGCTRQPTFAERVERAKAHEESAALKDYFEDYWRRIELHSNSALEQCFPLDKVRYKHATLVADLMPNRRLSNIQLNPDDRMTQCFATKFAASPFPAPPPSFGPGGLPVRAEVALHPSKGAP